MNFLWIVDDNTEGGFTVEDIPHAQLHAYPVNDALSEKTKYYRWEVDTNAGFASGNEKTLADAKHRAEKVYESMT